MNNLDDYDVNVTLTHKRCDGGFHKAPLEYELVDFLANTCIPGWAGLAVGLGAAKVICVVLGYIASLM